ncbi:MAG: hypothetical protein RBS72_08325 [Sedimentisphaerales bacterium]|nr:hypothetical protein [Sedimentisphaerales bacterium]HNY77761.1 hypothetical protein [Sedimentisphaerales bacterium]HOC63505.1 hypothetical protein [Sedimentisphaerales bacterium]HOH63936.1 hypothetical protein [Sedimentisphaerales bacterium]HPY50028.1 hypothetical protein [Sedimentisphaerales bacterium]
MSMIDERRWLCSFGTGKVISIKPHHFVDIITAFGDGCTRFEPHPYGHAVHRVAAEILADRDAMIRIEFGADDICGPCRHNIDGLCDDTIDTSFRPQAPKSKRQYNLLLDERWAERLGLRPGDELTARRFCLLLRDRAGDISDIYRENPAERTAQRHTKLQNGLAWFLA